MNTDNDNTRSTVAVVVAAIVIVLLVLLAGCARGPDRDGEDARGLVGSVSEPALRTAADDPPVADAGGGEPSSSERDDRPKGAANMSGAVEITDANFSQLTKNGVVLVDFWATWCPPCRMQGPIVERIAGEYEGKAVIGKLDVDSNQRTAARFGVQSIPTLIVFKDGQEVQRMIGLQTEQKLKGALDGLLRN